MRAKILMAALLLVSAAAPARADERLQTLEHDGQKRHYLLRAPAPLPADRRLPLVLVLHGGGGSAANAEQMTGFTAKAREQGFIVVYPEGSSSLGLMHTWNAVHCCGHAMEKNVDDVGFIRALLDHLQAHYPVDAQRIYVTGLSNGGMMTHRLGIELGDRIAAIAPVIATVFGDEVRPVAPVSALMINGAIDDNVPPGGGDPAGPGRRHWAEGAQVKPTTDQAQFWARADGCSATPMQSDDGIAVHWRYACPSQAVEQYLVKDNGHAWPGGEPGRRRADPPNPRFDATTVIWNFFAAHPKSPH